MSTFARNLDVGRSPAGRYAVDIIRRDGSYYRTVHLWADSPDDAIARTAGWLTREFVESTLYHPENARPAAPS